MKKKHYTIPVALIALISFLGIAVGISREIGNKAYGEYTPDGGFSSRPASTVHTRTEIDQLETIMNRFEKRRENTNSPLRLGLFGYEPVNDNWAGGKDNTNQLSFHIKFPVSLAFTDDNKSFCVIKGRFYKSGASLPDGGKILKIEKDQVLIRRHDLSEWVAVGRYVGDLNIAENAEKDFGDNR